MPKFHRTRVQLRRSADSAVPRPWGYDDGITDDKCDPPERGKDRLVQTITLGRGDRWENLALAQPIAICEIFPGFFPDADTDATGRYLVDAANNLPRLLDQIYELRHALRKIQELQVGDGGLAYAQEIAEIALRDTEESDDGTR